MEDEAKAVRPGQQDVPETVLEDELAGLVRVAATLCGAARAAIAVEEAGVVRLLARVGLRPRAIRRRDAWVSSGEVRIIPDISIDGQACPLAPYFHGMRFFASVPLEVPSGVVGALLVMDPSPRDLSASQREGLEVLARQAARVLEAARPRAAGAEREPGPGSRLHREQDKLAAAGRMAARVAHEINNPLAGIKNAFLLIKDAIPEDHRYARYVPRIEQEIDRIAAIVRQMLELYQPEPDGAREFPLEHALRDILDCCEPAARERGVQLALEVGRKERVDLPAGSFRQIVYNLVQNAIDVSPEGGTIRVRAEVVDGVLTCTVSDEGHGIPGEIQSHVFEPFFTTKTGRPGRNLGLGLPVCRGLAEGLGGSLGFSAGPAGGTTFRVILPVQRTRGEE